MTVCMYRDIHTLQPYIIDFTQRGCHTLRPTVNLCLMPRLRMNGPIPTLHHMLSRSAQRRLWFMAFLRRTSIGEYIAPNDIWKQYCLGSKYDCIRKESWPIVSV